jgi:hypothetical protein
MFEKATPLPKSDAANFDWLLVILKSDAAKKKKNQGKKMTSTPPHDGFSTLSSPCAHCKMALLLFPLDHWEKGICRVNGSGGGIWGHKYAAINVLKSFAVCKTRF